MSLEAWSVVWQVIVAGVCLAFFGLAAGVTWGAVRDARAMFRQLRRQPDGGRLERPS